MLNRVKLALRISGNAFDDEINGLIDAALADLEITGAKLFADGTRSVDPLVNQAVITYCKCNFGEPTDYDRLKKAYDEQKAQIRCNPKYRS